METTRKLVSFHREDRSSDPNNPQSILLDFISSCQNLRIWSLNTSTREYLNNEQLQKGKQIDEWWRQVSKGAFFFLYVSLIMWLLLVVKSRVAVLIVLCIYMFKIAATLDR